MAGGGARARGALVVTEVALGVVLLAGAALSIRSIFSLMNVELGFPPQNTTVVTYAIAPTPDLKFEELSPRHQRLLEAVRAVPGIEAVGGAKALPLVSSLIFGVKPNDPLTLAVVCLVLFVVAVLASWLPACRATRVDPAETLRAE